MITENLQCPLCITIQNNDDFFLDYPGSFLSCKRLIQCKNCQLVFVHKFPSKKELNQYYTSGLYYEHVNNPFDPDILNFSFKLAQSRLELLITYINTNRPLKVIDIGAGNGQLGLVLEKYIKDVKYDAIEPDEAITKQYGKHIHNHYNDLQNVDGTEYDLVFLNQVLEHVPDPVEFIVSLKNYLKPGGYIYIDVPYQDYLFKSNVVPHLLFWNKKSLNLLIEILGMKMIFCDSVGMPHRIARRFFNQQSLIEKIRNPWLYCDKINSFLRQLGIPQLIDTFQQYQAQNYGGKRQWLRCIAKTIL